MSNMNIFFSFVGMVVSFSVMGLISFHLLKFFLKLFDIRTKIKELNMLLDEQRGMEQSLWELWHTVQANLQLEYILQNKENLETLNELQNEFNKYMINKFKEMVEDTSPETLDQKYLEMKHQLSYYKEAVANLDVMRHKAMGNN